MLTLPELWPYEKEMLGLIPDTTVGPKNVGQNPRREWRVGQPPRPMHKPVKQAAKIFIEDGVDACREYLGARQDLLPKVFARAKYLERCAKRLDQNNLMGALAARAAEIQRLHEE